MKITAAVTAAAAVAFGFFHYFQPKPPPDVRPYLGRVFPASSFTKMADRPYPYFAAAGPDAAEGIAFLSTELAPSVRGYAGPVPVLVGLRPTGEITGVMLLDNSETPSYSEKVARPSFTGQFAGRKVTDPLELDKDIDGVTRATVTAGAVASGVRTASRRAASEIFGIRVPQGPGRLAGPLRDAGLYMLAALIVSALVFHIRGMKLRLVVLAVSLIFLGAAKASPLALVNILSVPAGRLPGVENLFWYALVFGVLLVTVGWGRLYCGWLCPFGAIQEFLARLPMPRVRVAPELDKTARGARFVLLWLAVVAAFLSGVLDAANFEPYVTLFSGRGGAAAWGLVGVSLAGATAVTPRFWCRYFCPVGAVLSLLTKAGRYLRRAKGRAALGANPPMPETSPAPAGPGRGPGGNLFRLFAGACLALALLVMAGNLVEGMRLRDPDYARMVEDRRRYEKVISKKGLSMRPALHWSPVPDGRPDGRR